MKPWGILILFVALGGLAGNGSAAENKRENPAPFTMETVVVTATRQAQKASSVPAHVTVITESDIKDATAGNIPDLLRTQAGLHITDITGNRRNFMVDVRGFGETAALNTLVLVDGRRINQADLSGTDWTLIPLDRVRRIEIIRGSRGAVLYGDNASGGVINIITKHGETFQTGAALQAGSYNTLKSSAYVSGSQDRLSFALSGSYLNSDGYRDNSGTEASDAGATLSYIVGDRLNLNFSTGYHQDDTSLPGAIKRSDFAAGISRTDSLSPKDFADVKDHYFKGGFEIFFLTDSMLKMDLSFRNRTAFAFSTFSGGNFKGDTEIDTLSASPQLILNEKVFGFKNHLTLGFDVADTTEDIINRSLYFGSSTVGSFKLEKKTDGYYLHDEMNLTDTLAISGGYRHDQARFRFRPSAPDSVTMEQDLFTAGINYNYYKNSHVYVSFSKSFRYPVLDELFNFFTNTINTGLLPQQSDNYEAGIRHFFTDDLSAGINLFQVDTAQEIFFNPANFANENQPGKTRRNGVEVYAAKKFDRVSLRGSYTYTDSKIKDGLYAGKEVPDVPQHQVSGEIQFYVGGGVTAALNGTYIGERPFISDFSNAFGPQDDYLILNAKVKYRRNRYTAFLDINNLTNEAYSEYGALGGFPVEQAFFPSPEINFILGVSADF